MLVVPHPKNRGGDAVKSLRTMQLTASIADGYDTVEANSNATAVEDKPVVTGTNTFFFQSAFEKQVLPDPDMAAKGVGIMANIGSLSHSHLNCINRNIVCSKRGRNCIGRKFCYCKSKVIFDDEGNLNLDRVRAHDEAWAQDCVAGLEWEVLSHNLDIEESDGALVISIALNKKKRSGNEDRPPRNHVCVAIFVQAKSSGRGAV